MRAPCRSPPSNSERTPPLPRARFKSLSIDPTTYEQLEQAARDEDRTLVAVLRRALAQYTASNRSN